MKKDCKVIYPLPEVKRGGRERGGIPAVSSKGMQLLAVRQTGAIA